MSNPILTQAADLKQLIIDAVLEAEGEPAIALETFTAQELSRVQHADPIFRKLLVERFVIEGRIGGTPVLQWFLQQDPELTACDRQLVETWNRSMIGLFAIESISTDGFEVMNWLTTKPYTLRVIPAQMQGMERLKPGEIVLTQIVPLTDGTWFIAGEWTSLGKLGKPKLAVAIGNFKQHYKPYLYSDAPDLLEEAWRSVEQQYHTFVEFFGGDEVTLPGYQLNHKLAEFQDLVTRQTLEAAGIDDSKSLKEMAEEAGLSQAEVETAVKEMGGDGKTLERLFQSKSLKATAKMIAPPVELPPLLKKAEELTVLSDPQWGQMFIPTYRQFQRLLEAENWQQIPNGEKLVRQYLSDREINAWIWHRLADRYTASLESILSTVLERPDLHLATDLDEILASFHKPLVPELPETASVPVHLHNLFQEAMAEVNKNPSKGKGGSKKNKGGFGL